MFSSIFSVPKYPYTNSKITYCGSSKNEEGNVKLWLFLLRYPESEERACPRRGEETKDFWEVRMKRIRCRERIMEDRGSFQWE